MMKTLLVSMVVLGCLVLSSIAADKSTYPAKSDLYLGLRCLVAQQHGYLKGAIDEARIYDMALDGEALAQLKPGVLTVPKPLGWWTFDGGSVKDGTGHYPDARLIGTLSTEGHTIGKPKPVFLKIVLDEEKPLH